MKQQIINCPNCHSRKYKIITRQYSFSFDQAATGAIIGGIVGRTDAALFSVVMLGIDGKSGKTWIQCDVCGHVWKE